MAAMMMSRGVGGGHFRKKIEAGIETTLSDVTHEGLFGDYYFTVGEEKEKDFKPSYSFAVVRDPLSNEQQHYLCVGLVSKYDGEGIHKYGRPCVQLCICLDTSGSMNCDFDKPKKGDEPLSKLEAAKKALFVLFTHLRKDDMFALITFDEEAHTIQALTRWDTIDQQSLKNKVQALTPSGGTNLSVGFASATAMLEAEAKNRVVVQPAAGGGVAQQGEVQQQRPTERRIMFLTDMNPNVGQTDADELFHIADKNAKIGIFSTFIGVGLDFNTELVNHITTNILAASYFSVLSESDFRQQMAEDFDYLVCPLVFHVTLALKAKTKHIAIDRIYGSPESDEATGELMKVGTLFPSNRIKGETKGGVVLIKLNVDKQGEGGQQKGEQGEKDDAKVEVEGQADKTKLELSVSFAARDSEGLEKQVETVEMVNHQAPYFQNMGVRKALLLTQFANLVTALITSASITTKTGIPTGLSSQQKKDAKTKKDVKKDSTTTSSSSVSGGSTYRDKKNRLLLTPETVKLVTQFQTYFREEATVIGDPKLDKEAAVLQTLLDQNAKALKSHDETAGSTTEVGGY